METSKDFSNGLLKRKELVVVLKEKTNPGIEKVKKEIAEKFKSKEENIVIKKVVSGFGSNEFKVDAYIYEDVATKEAVEPKKKEKKKAGGT
jgi:ribosomal protein S24E